MTFGEMKTEIANRLGDDTADTNTRIGEIINDTMFSISDELQYPGELKEGRIRTESGRDSYPLEADVLQVIEPMTVPEQNANIWQTPVETMDTYVQAPTATSTPHHFMMLGNFGVERQPASLLTFGSQTNAISATINGMVDYLPVSEVLALTSGSTTDTVNLYTTVDKITLTGVPSGTMGVTANATLVKVAEFTSSETEAVTSAYGLYNPGSIISFYSSEASDSTDRTAVIRGYGLLADTGGFPAVADDNVYIEESIASNGTTGVDFTNKFTTIESVSIDAETVGTFSFTGNPSARRIATIPQKKRSLDIPIVGFYPIPNGERINYKYYRRMTPLSINADRPPMDERVHYYIKKWAEASVLSWYGDSRGVQETIQNALPSWNRDMSLLRVQLGLSANPSVVIGGRAVNISARHGATALLDPAHYSN